MMNKKAIAAFAAGATLLAGFAMATPAFAAAPDNTKSQEVKKSKADLKKDLDAARTAYYAAVEAQKTADAASKNADTAFKAIKTKPAKGIKGDETNGYTFDATASLNEQEAKDAHAYVNAWDLKQSTAKTAAEAAKKVTETQNTFMAADKAYSEAKDPVEKSDEQKQEDAIEAVMNAKGTLDRLRVKKNKLYSEVMKKRSALKKAQANEERSKKALEAAEDELKAFNDSGAEDSARGRQLELRRNRAEAKHEAAVKDLNKATDEYTEVYNKYTPVLDAFKQARTDYDTAYDKAIRLGVDPAKLPLVSTAEDPLDNDFLGDPGTAAEVLSGKTPAQPGANGAAAGANGAAGKAGANGSAAAGAKTEVENKNGKDKRGNTHTGTGVGVTLTALAATMLAGMGAAVRKARH